MMLVVGEGGLGFSRFDLNDTLIRNFTLHLNWRRRDVGPIAMTVGEGNLEIIEAPVGGCHVFIAQFRQAATGTNPGSQ